MDKTQIDQREDTVNRTKHWVRLTRVCNNRCIFCLDKEAQDGSCVPIEDIKKDLARGKSRNLAKVILSGGEPTIHPDFLGIVRLAKKLGFQDVQVISNGRMFAYHDFLAAGVKAGVSEITFSVHGHNEELHDKQTQVKGSFRQTLKGLLNALKMQNLIVNVDVVINKLNVKHLADILKYLINLGISEFDLLQVIPFGMAWDNKDRVFYNIDKSLVYLRKAFELSKNPNLNIWTNRFPAKYLEGYEALIQNPVKLYDEINGRKEVFEQFLNNGKKIACVGARCRYCFLNDFCQDLAELKRKKELIAKVYPLCLNASKSKPHSNIHKEHLFEFINGKIGIFNFLDFYISHRYFVKGLVCNCCKFDKYCQGMPIEYVRESGFRK